ncbi:hypothetical protein ENBRE01_0940 [Enteropsectra breve]|nr:hypothetical protein ENBRE01_0940 [Enteropsectra breve]
MKTRGYKVGSILVQTVSLALICASAYLIIFAIAAKRGLKIAEDKCNNALIVTFYGSGIKLNAINVLIALFAICGVTSGNKMIMGIYTFVSLVFIFVNVAFLIYMSFIYKSQFNLTVGSEITKDVELSHSLNLYFGVSMRAEALEAIKMDMLEVLALSAKVQLSVILSSIFLIALVKYLNGIRLKKPDVKIPPITEMSKLGLNTSALDNRRIVSLAL